MLELSRVDLSHRNQNGFKLSGVLRNHGFEKSGVKLWSLSEANPRETRFGSKYREVSGNRGFKKSGFHCRMACVCTVADTCITDILIG